MESQQPEPEGGEARYHLPRFIERHGKEQCDKWLAEFQQAEAAYRRFVALVKKAESHHQLQRIEARLEFPGFIKEHGKEQCDAWFERLKSEEPII